jgi:hypothetical protein
MQSISQNCNAENEDREVDACRDLDIGSARMSKEINPPCLSSGYGIEQGVGFLQSHEHRKFNLTKLKVRTLAGA